MTPTNGHTGGDAGAAFKDMLNAYLMPLLFGARILGPERLARGSLPAVSHHGPHRLRIALEERGREFCTIERKVPFTEEERVFIERVIVTLHEKSRGGAFDFALVNCAVEWAVARRVNAEHAASLYEIFQIYKEWSAPENRGAAHTVGLYFSRSKGPGGNFFSLRGESCLKSMGVSAGTLLALGRGGDILSVEKIPPPPADRRRVRDLAAPLAFADLALWSSGRKAAVHLRPDGSILVFAGKRLLFMRREEYWRSFPHSLAGIDELLPDECPSTSAELRRAVYLSCLDLSFAGQRACIGILADGGRACPGLCPGGFFTAGGLSGGGKLLAGLIRDKRFQDLPRIFRLEMAVMDGPLLLDDQGRILSAGAGFSAWGAVASDAASGASPTLSPNAPPGGPGREAARAFAQKGLGVFISEAGTVELFGSRYTPAPHCARYNHA